MDFTTSYDLETISTADCDAAACRDYHIFKYFLVAVLVVLQVLLCVGLDCGHSQPSKLSPGRCLLESSGWWYLGTIVIEDLVDLLMALAAEGCRRPCPATVVSGDFSADPAEETFPLPAPTLGVGIVQICVVPFFLEQKEYASCSNTKY